MMPHMMNGLMMSGFAFLWISIGVFLFLLLAIMLLWVLMHKAKMHALQPSTTNPQMSEQSYEQGYQPQAPTSFPEEQSYYSSPQSSDEQPSACYPQAIQQQ